MSLPSPPLSPSLPPPPLILVHIFSMTSVIDFASYPWHRKTWNTRALQSTGKFGIVSPGISSRCWQRLQPVSRVNVAQVKGCGLPLALEYLVS
jgi:hypothetical protein